jgi:hypothetical protein
MKIDGGCHCGHIAYEAEADPAKTMICHCADCQTLSGSPFRAVILTREDTFKLRSGKLHTTISECRADSTRITDGLSMSIRGCPLPLRQCGKVRPDDLDHAFCRGAGREEADISSVHIDKKDETAVIEVWIAPLRRLRSGEIDFVGAGDLSNLS